MEKQLLINSNLRAGSPVVVNGVITFIMSVDHVGEEDIFGVFGNAARYKIEELKPVPIDDVYETYVYMFADTIEGDPDCKGTIVFSKQNPRVTFDMDHNLCYVDGEKAEIHNLHELFNVVEDYCGYKLPHYYPIGDMTSAADRPANRVFPEAPCHDKR